MIKFVPKYLLIFIVCILLQILIFNEMQIVRFLNPSFYILFILLLPFETPKWLQLMAAFGIGLTVDSFINTPGINAAACTLLAFLRPLILKLLSPREGYEVGQFPRIMDLGFGWFLKYSFILILFHQIALFFIEAFTFKFFGLTLVVVLANTVATTFFVMLSQYVMFKR